MHATDPVNRIMSEPVLTVGPDDSVREMLRVFASYPVHHLPVVRGREVVGMLSSADLLKLEFFLPPPGPTRDALLNDRFKVAKVMRTPAITVTEHESVQRAAEIMATNAIHSVPVVNRDDHLIGIVTTTDLMNACLSSSTPRSLADSSVDHLHAIDANLTDTISKARAAVANDADPDGFAATLLNLQKRIAALELVAIEAKRYLNAGQDERLHAALNKAIQRLDQLAGQPAMIGLSSTL